MRMTLGAIGLGAKSVAARFGRRRGSLNSSALRTLSDALDLLRRVVSSDPPWQGLGSAPVAVLVVDDDPVCRRALVLSIRSEGMRITECENGEKALQCLRENSFDVILSDLMMPGMDGFPFTTQLRKLRPRNHPGSPGHRPFGL